MAGPVVRRLVAAGMLLVLGSACSSAEDTLLLERFFAASRLRDQTALDRFATVIFEPTVDGTVSTLDVVRVSPEVVQDGPATPNVGRVTEISLDDPLADQTSAPQQVVLVGREVTIDARVRRPDGSIGTERLLVELRRAIVKQPPRTGRWVVTGFRAGR